jgi:hypothetical protein
LVTGLRCSSDGDIIDGCWIYIGISLQEATHSAHHQVIGASTCIHAAGLTEWGADSIDEDD